MQSTAGAAGCNAAGKIFPPVTSPEKCRKEKERKNKKMENQKELAKTFCAAIKTLSERPENMENLELYLSNHFETWLKKFAYDPVNLTYELKMFAEMEI